MWRSFDLVGITELFDEFMVELSDLVGLPFPAYRMQIVAEHTLASQQAQRNWTSRSCSSVRAARYEPQALRRCPARTAMPTSSALHGSRLPRLGSYGSCCSRHRRAC